MWNLWREPKQGQGQNKWRYWLLSGVSRVFVTTENIPNSRWKSANFVSCLWTNSKVPLHHKKLFELMNIHILHRSGVMWDQPQACEAGCDIFLSTAQWAYILLILTQTVMVQWIFHTGGAREQKRICTPSGQGDQVLGRLLLLINAPLNSTRRDFFLTSGHSKAFCNIDNI